MGRRESTLEAWAVSKARFWGAIVAKLKELDGVPDRVFFLPNGVVVIIEFKAKDEVPEDLQNWYIEKLEEYGFQVHWCDTKEAFRCLMEKLWTRGKTSGLQRKQHVPSRTKKSKT